MMKVHVIGVGAIGGIAAAWMSRAGEDVTWVDVNREHVEALRTSGLLIDGGRGTHTFGPQRALTVAELLEAGEPLHCVFLACKAQHTRDAVAAFQHLLAPDGFVVSLQNGLVQEEEIAAVVGPERTIGALPDYGGAYIEPGHLEFVIEGPVYVGELDGRVTPRVQAVHRLLAHVCEAHLTTDIVARIWAKTCYGAQVVTSALVDLASYKVLEDERARRVVGPMVREALEVAYALGIQVPGGPFFRPELYFCNTPDDTQRFFAFLDEALAKLSSYRRQEFEKPGGHKFIKKASGIHWDIKYRKRRSEVQWSHGPLEEKAAAVGHPLPLNRRLHQLIYAIEAGEREMGWHNIEELLELTHQVGKAMP